MCRQSRPAELLTIDQVPRYLRYNYYIRSGYRPPPKTKISSHRNLLRSICSLHNESVNIWTHLFALFMFLLLAIYELFIRSGHIRWCVFITCFACVLTFYGSIMYHSSMNQCQCQKDYHKCLNYDVMGVLLSCTFSGISPVIYGYRCNYPMLVVFAFLVLTASVTFASLKVFQQNVTASIRGKYIAIHAVLRTVLALAMVSGNVIWHQRMESIKWHSIGFILLIVGGAINVSRYPEKLFVNKYVSSFFLVRDRAKLKIKIDAAHKKNCEEIKSVMQETQDVYHELLDAIRYSIDYIGNSHQIWHVFVILSCIVVYYACVWDDLYFQNTVCEGNDLYELAQRSKLMMSDIEHVRDQSSMYAVAMDLIFEPSFLYPFS